MQELKIQSRSLSQRRDLKVCSGQFGNMTLAVGKKSTEADKDITVQQSSGGTGSPDPELKKFIKNQDLLIKAGWAIIAAKAALGVTMSILDLGQTRYASSFAFLEAALLLTCLRKGPVQTRHLAEKVQNAGLTLLPKVKLPDPDRLLSTLCLVSSITSLIELRLGIDSGTHIVVADKILTVAVFSAVFLCSRYKNQNMARLPINK